MIRIKSDPAKRPVTESGYGKSLAADILEGQRKHKKALGKLVKSAPKKRVTKPRKPANIVTPPAPVSGAGRPKVHATPADRQRAYRERQKVKA